MANVFMVNTNVNKSDSGVNSILIKYCRPMYNDCIWHFINDSMKQSYVRQENYGEHIKESTQYKSVSCHLSTQQTYWFKLIFQLILLFGKYVKTPE